MRIEEFFLEGRKVGVVQLELELQRVVGDPPAAAEQGENLVEHSVKVSPHLPALLVSGYGPVFWPSIAKAWMRLHVLASPVARVAPLKLHVEALPYPFLQSLSSAPGSGEKCV